MSVENANVQLRIGFAMPNRPHRWLLSSSGLVVRVEPTDGDHALVGTYLAAVGVTPATDPAGGTAFALAQLPALLDLPDRVEVICDERMRGIWELVRFPAPAGSPVVVEQDDDATFTVAWRHGERDFFESVPVTLAPALSALGVPLVASDDTWRGLLGATQTPPLAGRMRVNLDGFVEIDALAPQQVESAPIPALFRLDDTHFGVPLQYAAALDDLPGFVWDGPRPAGPPAVDVHQLPLALSEHASEDLDDLVASLSTAGAQAVVWDSGLGRRIFCLAAVEALDAFPLLVVTEPWGVWPWQRHLDLLGRSGSLFHDRADVHLVTYRDLSSRDHIASPAAVIFDDLDRAVARHGHDDGLHRLDGLVDLFRIGCCATFPADLEAGAEVMAVLRPAEFRSGVAAVRYPLRPEQRAREHLEAYLSRREAGPGERGHGFRSSRVEVVEPTAAILEAFESALARPRAYEDLLNELLTVVSSGPSYALSPKVARAAELALADLAQQRRVAIVTRHDRTAQILAATLRTHRLPVVTEPQGGHSEIIRMTTTPGDLSVFESVIFVDYPWSTSVIDDAVGHPRAAGPASVTVLHMCDSVDDRIAMLAARRRERASVSDVNRPPTMDELRYLLMRRDRLKNA